MLVLLLVMFVLYTNNINWVIQATEVPTKMLNDENKIPMIGLGTVIASAKDISKLRDAISWAVAAGYRHIDTAANFDNEQIIGKGIRDALKNKLAKREDLFISTKLPYDRHAHDQVIPALQESLEKLGLDYVDLYLIHTPVSKDTNLRPTHVDFLETWKGMESAKKLGLAKSIGVSNFEVDQVSRLMDNSNVKPAVNQIEVNPTYNRTQLVQHCQKLGITVLAYAPFGFMVDRPSFQFGAIPPPKMNDPVLKKIGQKYNKTTPQVVLRYLIDRDLIPIPKAFTKRHLQENVNVFNFQLTPQEVHTISRFNRDQGVYHWQ